MKAFNFSSINLGCAKNLVDTQFILGKILTDSSFEMNYFSEPQDKEVEFVFLNTCGFLSTARLEMFDTIKMLHKKNKKIILFGCAVNFYQNIYSGNIEDEIVEMMSNPNIMQVGYDKLGTLTAQKILDYFEKSQEYIGEIQSKALLLSGTRVYTNAQLGFEYLKIAEGCNNSCSFCLIPKIRGKQKSLEIEKILEEITNMVNSGIKEIILIAQDISRYGIDLYGQPKLFELLEEIEKIKLDFKYRLLYLYPDLLTLDSIEKFKKLKKFIPYFDIPFQHISDKILKSMKRYSDSQRIKDFIKTLKMQIPECFLRTNLIIGFPGETDEDFDMLKNFVKENDFDNISIFQFHDERFADSFNILPKVNEKTINQRFVEIKKIVDDKIKISKKRFEGKEILGYIENVYQNRKGETKLVVRPEICAPEMDFTHDIDLEQILDTFGKNEIDIGDKVIYHS